VGANDLIDFPMAGLAAVVDDVGPVQNVWQCRASAQVPGGARPSAWPAHSQALAGLHAECAVVDGEVDRLDARPPDDLVGVQVDDDGDGRTAQSEFGLEPGSQLAGIGQSTRFAFVSGIGQRVDRQHQTGTCGVRHSRVTSRMIVVG
jgi:hypothetical protein